MPVASTLDPWREKGIPLEEQYRSWKQRVKTPYDKREVDAYTRTRVILMNGIEVEAWNYSHAFARCTDNPEIKALLARTRMVEQQQQTTVNWLNPADWPSARYQEAVNADGIPSEEIVDLQRQRREPPDRPGDELLERARQVAVQVRSESGALKRGGA